MIEREHRAVFTEQLQQRRRGRPRRDTPVFKINVKVPEDVYDELCRLSLRRGVSVHSIARSAIERETRFRRS